MVKTAVISARIPNGIKVDLDMLLKRNNMTTSEFIQSAVSSQIVNKAKKGGILSTSVASTSRQVKLMEVGKSYEIDEEFANILLSVGGGSTLGFAVYYLVKELVDKYYPEHNAKDIASISGIAVGLGSTLGIMGLLNKDK